MDSDKELPDIPYTPMRDGSIDEGATTSSGTDPPDPKRPRAMMEAERKAKSRAAKLAKQTEVARAKNCEEKALQRLGQMAEKREEAKQKNCKEKALERLGQSREMRTSRSKKLQWQAYG